MRAHFLKPKIRTPAPIMIMPNHSLDVGRSCRKITAKIATSRRLNLSTGATFEASPIFNAPKVADPRNASSQAGQNQKEPGPRAECEGIAPFASAIHEPGESDHNYESANQRCEIRIDALQADFGKYRRKCCENSGKKSPVKPVMCYCHRRHAP